MNSILEHLAVQFRRLPVLMFVTVLVVSGCSSSSDSNSSESQTTAADFSGTTGDAVASVEGTDGVTNEMADVTSADTTSGTQAESTDVTDESLTGIGTESTTESSGLETPTTTSVNFDITVPAFMSDALQVRLVWGDKDVLANFVVGELWRVTDDFPTNTENQLVVTFSDNNGAITLGSFEASFRTGSNPSESFQIAADQFDTDQFDSDGDGVSNLNESIAGTNPQGTEALEPVEPSIEFVADKTFRISWQSTAAAQFYRVLENPDGVSGFTDISGELEATTTSFDHRVALFARVNAQYLVRSCNDQGCVDSDVLIVTGTLANAIGYLKASNTGMFDNFGVAVSLSADGNTLAVGANVEDSTATGINGDQNDDATGQAGAVYIFVRSSGLWQQQAYLKASNTGNGDGFGEAVSLSADGNTLAIGALGEDSSATGINGNQNDNSASGSGAVYVFVRSGGNWQQQAYIKASSTRSTQFFGGVVSLSANGNTLAVGAEAESSSATGIDGNQNDFSAGEASRESGAAYVFIRSGELWQQQAYIKASNTGGFDRFGIAVSLSADGNTLAVGADGEDSATTGINGDQNDNSAAGSGAVYVFVRIGELWQQQAYIKANIVLATLGRAVSLSADGSTLAAGALFDQSAATGVNGDQNDDSADDSGAVYVFVRSGEFWQQQAYIKASNTGEDDTFGVAVSLSADGNTLAVGADREDSAATGIDGNQNDNSTFESGALYIFVRSGEFWQQQAYIKASNTGQDDSFGGAVSLSADGDTLAVGARGEGSAATGFNGDQNDNSTPASASGAVYLY